MADIYNDQRVLGVRIVPEGTVMHNDQKVVGVTGVGPLSSGFYGETKTSDYTTTPADLATVVAVSTGTGVVAITLMPPTGYQAAVQPVEKIDDGSGFVLVYDDTGSLLAELISEGDRMAFTPDADASGWHAVAHVPRHRAYLSQRAYYPYEGMTAFGLGVGVLVPDVTYIHPIDLRETVKIDAFSIYIGPGSPTGLQIKTALYGYNPDNPAKPDGAPLLAEGAVVGGVGVTLAQGPAPSVLGSPQLLRGGRGWAVAKISVANAANSLFSPSNAGLPLGGRTARDLWGFTADPLKGYSIAATPFADAFPLLLPAATETLAGTVALAPRVL